MGAGGGKPPKRLIAKLHSQRVKCVADATRPHALPSPARGEGLPQTKTVRLYQRLSRSIIIASICRRATLLLGSIGTSSRVIAT